YTASRQRDVRGPHHAFADIAGPADIPSFFERFGFPSFHGRQVRVDEVLIAAKQLRLLMQAWGAFGSGDIAGAQRHLSELGFARGYDARWFYWPPELLPDIGEEAREAASLARQFLEVAFK